MICILFIIFFLSFPAVGAHGTVRPPKNPNSAKACALCHYRWIDTFFIEGRGSELVAYTSEKVVASAEMCFSCHDGSVADSRARAYRTGQHKVGVPPPAGMKIPELFPLDEKGNMQCATCHSAHGVPSGPDSAETIFMRTSNRNSAMCRMCHPGRTGGLPTGNHPMEAGKEGIPEALFAGYAKAGDRPNEMICETCHTAHGARAGGLLLADNDNCGLCLACHRNKAVVTPEGRKKPFHIINAVPRKTRIPESVMRRGARLAGNGAIVCRTCHKVHKNKTERLLVIAMDGKGSLCLACHAEQQAVLDTRHNLALSAPQEKNLEGKTVAQAGPCSACHLPHKAARRIATGLKPANGLCLSCHSRGRVAQKAVLAGVQHPLNVPLAIDTNRIQGGLPLFDDAGFVTPKGKIACATCHDPHRRGGQTHPDGDGGQGDAGNHFLRRAISPSPVLCAACHRNQAYVENTDHDLRITAPSSRNILGRTPLESGACGVCHLVHNGPNRLRLWARGFGDGNNIMETLCNDCHSRGGPAEKKIPQVYLHPRAKRIITDKSIPKTSPEYFPLFHGRSGEIVTSGNISCPSCHNVHQWDPEVRRRGRGSNVEGDAGNRFLRPRAAFEICRSCHKADADARIKYYHDAGRRKFRSIDDMFFR